MLNVRIVKAVLLELLVIIFCADYAYDSSGGTGPCII